MSKLKKLTVGLFVSSVAFLGLNGTAFAGIMDDPINNSQIIDHIGFLNTNINSDPVTTENVNANARVKGSTRNNID